MRCKFKSILRGDVVKPGQVLDLTKEECRMDVVKQAFTKVGNGEAGGKSPAADNAEKVTTLVAGLTREQAILKIQETGANVKGNVSNKALVELYNQIFANAAEATKSEGDTQGDADGEGEGNGEGEAGDAEPAQESLDLGEEK